MLYCAFRGIYSASGSERERWDAKEQWREHGGDRMAGRQVRPERCKSYRRAKTHCQLKRNENVNMVTICKVLAHFFKILEFRTGLYCTKFLDWPKFRRYSLLCEKHELYTNNVFLFWDLIHIQRCMQCPIRGMRVAIGCSTFSKKERKSLFCRMCYRRNPGAHCSKSWNMGHKVDSTSPMFHAKCWNKLNKISLYHDSN